MVEPTKINPIIEFYEYQIHKYKPINRFYDFEKDNTTLFKFGNLTDSDDNKCRRVGIEGAITMEMDTQRTTCDPLTTLSGGEKKYKVFTTNENLNPFPIYDIENLYNNYKEFFAKYEVTDTLTINSVNKILKNLDDAIINQEKYIKSFRLSDSFNQYLKNVENLKLDDLVIINQTDSIIIKLDITRDTKIIMFGDFHGSFHTFFRLLCRLHKYDILDLDTFKIKDNYKLIFLGDILDRGKYTLDIINIIFKLIAINNTSDLKVIYNRGNHESFEIFERDGSLEEFALKIGKDKLKPFLTKYIKLLNLLPSAVVLNCENNLFWCSHGGFPISFLEKLFLDGFANNKLIYLTGQDSIHIRWNDFGDASKSIDYGLSGRGGNIYKLTARGTNKFLDTHNINFIIRGHQDSKGNSFLFQTDGNINVIGDPRMTDKDKFLFYNKSIKAFGTRVEGPIARLKLNKEIANKFNYFPVLTISTNTDAKRFLNSDSFVLLRFDISEGEEHLFKNFLNSIKKINEVLQSNNINMSSIFINNLNIIIDMLKLIDTNTYYLFSYYAQNYSTLNLQTDSNNKLINTNEIFKILNFINDIHDDCIEFFKYYQQKYFNLHEKLTDLIKYNRIDHIQTNSIEIYINSYKAKVDECKNILMKIKQNINNFTNFTNDQIKLLKQNDLFILNDKLNQKLILLQKSSL
jgi:hypothetical protein